MTANNRYQRVGLNGTDLDPDTLSSPIQVDIELTEFCPLKCFHCSVRASPEGEKYALSTHEWKGILDDLNKSGVFSIYFIGGEPFAREDLGELCKYAKELGLMVGIGTNGLYVSPSTIARVRDYVDFIQVSIDGITPETHNTIRGAGFESAIKAAGIIVKHNIPLHIGTVVFQTNYLEITDIFKFALNIGAVKFNLMGLQFAGRAQNVWKSQLAQKEQWINLLNFFDQHIGVNKENIIIELGFPLFVLTKLYSPSEVLIWHQEFPSQINPHICGCGRTRCTITHKGDVLPCDLSRSMIAGNMRMTEFDEIWTSEVMHPFRHRECYVPCECAECSYLQVCYGGCVGTRYNFHGNLKKADPRCGIYSHP